MRFKRFWKPYNSRSEYLVNNKILYCFCLKGYSCKTEPKLPFENLLLDIVLSDVQGVPEKTFLSQKGIYLTKEHFFWDTWFI